MDQYIGFSEEQKCLMIIPKINGEFTIPIRDDGYTFIGTLTKEQYMEFILWQSHQKELTLESVKAAVEKYSKVVLKS